MKVPLSWLKEFVDITLSIEELAYRLTVAGLEVEEIRYVGLPLPIGSAEGRSGNQPHPETKVSGFAWEREKIVVGGVLEVMPHPNADRLVLCRLDDGKQEHVVLTGAPNLYPYKGKGLLEKPLKVAYAKEGATIIDAYKPGNRTTKLKRKKIRGVESYSMACSEKELGISDEHEGIIILDDDAPTGMPLVDYLGDAVFDIAITPNIARAASIIGVAREVAALTDTALRPPNLDVLTEGSDIRGKANIEITEPDLNPRFVLGLIEDIVIKPSPYRIQYRLKLAGMRPIDNIVDATNYTMLEIGEPLHAFDYDVLVKRAGGKPPTIITRRAKDGERLTTLDEVERQLDDFTVLVCDTAGPLSIAGVMGGLESEVVDQTQNILLEGAAWNFINIRRTVTAQRLPSEAAYRFERGVHPALASQGVLRCLELMRQWSGGKVAKGLIDNYPLPPDDPIVTFSTSQVKQWLGIELAPDDVANILKKLEFDVTITGDELSVSPPPYRLDINNGIVGVADVMEEIARIYGYDKIPETRIADEIPPQRGNRPLEIEEKIRDILVGLGLQEVITHRLTSPEREGRRLSPESSIEEPPYFTLANPISSDRNVLRHSILTSMLETIERNSNIRHRLGLFEIGPVFLPSNESPLPNEVQKIVISITGPRALPNWQGADTTLMDFYDLKGIIDSLFESLHIQDVQYKPTEHPTFHPGKCASVMIGDRRIGTIGELHPLVKQNFDLPEPPLLMAELDLLPITNAIPSLFTVQPIPTQPPILEDLAIVVDINIPAKEVETVIKKAGGRTLTDVKLFDLYLGEQVGEGKKSLAYSLTYQAADRTLTDKEVAKIRNKIVRNLGRELGAKLRD